MKKTFFTFLSFLISTAHYGIAGNAPGKEQRDVEFTEPRQGERYTVNNVTVTTRNTNQEVLYTNQAEEFTYTSYRTPSALEVDKVRASLTDSSLLTQVKVKANLYLPKHKRTEKFPLVIICPGSEGIKHTRADVLKQLDLFYADQGIAYCHLHHDDNSTSQNQFQLSLESQAIDAFELAKIFSKFDSFDAEKIGIAGISRGANVADLASRVEYQQAYTTNFSLNPSSFQFNSHLGIAPLMLSQEQDPVLTGKPLLYFTAENDDLTPSKPVEDYITLLNNKGYTNAHCTVLKGAFHAFYVPGIDEHRSEVQNLSKCGYRYQPQGWLPLDVPFDAQEVKPWNELGQWVQQHVTSGATKKYNEQAAEQMAQEIIAFNQKYFLQS